MARRKDAGSGRLKRESVPLDERLYYGRRKDPIEQVRQRAKLKVTEYSADQSKFLAKIYRGHILVVQELVEREDYAIDDIREAYLKDIADGEYDEALTVVYSQKRRQYDAGSRKRG